MRATIIVSVDVPEERAAAEAWFTRWRPQLSYCSDNTGCGCCIDSWNVEGPGEAIAEIPDDLRARSDWTHPQRSEKAPKPPVRKKGQKLPKPRG